MQDGTPDVELRGEGAHRDIPAAPQVLYRY